METLMHMTLETLSARQYSQGLDSALKNAFPTNRLSCTQEMHSLYQ